MVRSALVLLAGVVVAVIIVSVMDTVAGSLYAVPAGTDRTNPESMRRAVALLPATAFVILLSGWILAAAVGSFVAARLATHDHTIHGMIVAMFVLVATVGNLAAIPHPAWLWPATLILIPAGGWLATKLVVLSRRAQ
jgi:hypothetical protein